MQLTRPYLLRKRCSQPEWMLPADAGFLARIRAIACCPTAPTSLSQALYFEATANLTGDMLVKVDRMSMANSLEVRCPVARSRTGGTRRHHSRTPGKSATARASAFCSTRSATACPRAAEPAQDGLSASLCPIWFRGALRDFLRDTLLGARFLGRGFVSPDFVRYMLDEHQSGRRNNATWLWRLLALELWCADYLQPVTAPPAPGQITARASGLASS